ncbi:hypothetical protein ACHAP3_002794 [Botrytis cinerea]
MSFLNHTTTNPETQQQNPQMSREQKNTSEPWIPGSSSPNPRSPRSKLNFKLHNPPPQPSSSSSSSKSSPSSRLYSSAPSSPIRTAPTTPPSNLTSKMRNLWNTSHSKSFLSNLNMGLGTNFPLKNLHLHSKKNVPVVYAGADDLFGRGEYDDYINHTNYSDKSKHSPTAMPIPKLSSPNGKPAKSLVSYRGNDRVASDADANPLSGPSTQHAEYLISRVEGQFMDLESPFGEGEDAGMDDFLGPRGGGLSFGFGVENGRYGDEQMNGVDEDDESAGDRLQEDMKSRRGKGSGKMVQKKQNPKTWKSIHQSCKEMLDSMHLSKCDGEITKATGQENGNRFVDADGYMGMDMDMAVDIEDETENDNAEKYDESDVFTDAHSSPSSGKYWEQNQPYQRLIHTESQDSMVEIYTSSAISTSPSCSTSSLEKHEQAQAQAQAKRGTEIEDELNESPGTPRKPLRESDFAYMHMQPKRKTPLAGEIDNANTTGDSENANTDRYSYPNNANDDQDNDDARSSLDMEDSLYDDVEKPVLRMARAAARYPDFATMMDTSMYTDPYKDIQSQAALSGSRQSLEFDADAALEASLSSLARLQFEYQHRCSEGARGEVMI